jgi:ferredoxin
MSDVNIYFQRERLGGIVAVGSYMSDVFRRFGVKFEKECDRAGGFHVCAVSIEEGWDRLSDLTRVELEHLAKNGRRTNVRLACEARIIKPGELVIMTEEKKEAPKQEQPKKDKFQEEFEAMPLEKKIASLLRMEAVTLGETFAYVVNSPMKVVEKVGDVIAEFGVKLEQEAKKAARPQEPKAEPAAPKGPSGKGKGSSGRKSAPDAPKA